MIDAYHIETVLTEYLFQDVPVKEDTKVDEVAVAEKITKPENDKEPEEVQMDTTESVEAAKAKEEVDSTKTVADSPPASVTEASEGGKAEDAVENEVQMTEPVKEEAVAKEEETKSEPERLNLLLHCPRKKKL